MDLSGLLSVIKHRDVVLRELFGYCIPLREKHSFQEGKINKNESGRGEIERKLKGRGKEPFENELEHRKDQVRFEIQGCKYEERTKVAVTSFRTLPELGNIYIK